MKFYITDQSSLLPADIHILAKGAAGATNRDGVAYRPVRAEAARNIVTRNRAASRVAIPRIAERLQDLGIAVDIYAGEPDLAVGKDVSLVVVTADGDDLQFWQVYCL